MPPTKGESSPSTVRRPARAAVMAAAVPAEPPPTTTRSASRTTGTSSAGTTIRSRAMTPLRLGGFGGAARARLLAEPFRDRGHGLEQHVEARDRRPGGLLEGRAVGGERLIERLLLTGGDPVALGEAGVHLLGQPFELLLAVLPEAGAHHLVPQRREG